jgi:hypothetical protein
VSELTSPASDDALMVAPSLTASSLARLQELGWSWVTDAGQLHLRFPNRVVEEPAIAVDVERSPDYFLRLPRRGLGTFAVLRRLLLSTPLLQVDLATATGLTQPRVSQILSRLSDQGLVVRDITGWAPTDWDRGLEVWLSSYPGPHGLVTYWSGLDDVWSTTLTALNALPDDAVVSGDVAADLLEPWRQPQSAMIYVPAMDNLAGTGLVQVPAPADGAVAVCVPDDRTVWPADPITRPFRDRMISIADPLQVLSDVAKAQDEDSARAAEHLTKWIRDQYADGASNG